MSRPYRAFAASQLVPLKDAISLTVCRGEHSRRRGAGAPVETALDDILALGSDGARQEDEGQAISPVPLQSERVRYLNPVTPLRHVGWQAGGDCPFEAASLPVRVPTSDEKASDVDYIERAGADQRIHRRTIPARRVQVAI